MTTAYQQLSDDLNNLKQRSIKKRMSNDTHCKHFAAIVVDLKSDVIENPKVGRRLRSYAREFGWIS